jgi:dGTPase
MHALKEFNYEHIYRHPEVERKSRKAASIIELLYHELERILDLSERGRNHSFVSVVVRESNLMSVFFDFIKNTNYNDETPSWRIVTDYIAGMTDSFAQRTFMQLFMPDPVI